MDDWSTRLFMAYNYFKPSYMSLFTIINKNDQPFTCPNSPQTDLGFKEMKLSRDIKQDFSKLTVPIIIGGNSLEKMSNHLLLYTAQYS